MAHLILKLFPDGRIERSEHASTWLERSPRPLATCVCSRRWREASPTVSPDTLLHLALTVEVGGERESPCERRATSLRAAK